jgi:hypothetical protein
MQRTLPWPAVLAAIAALAHGTDIGVAPKKLLVLELGGERSKAKLVFLAKDPGIFKGNSTDPNGISATFTVSFD